MRGLTDEEREFLLAPEDGGHPCEACGLSDPTSDDPWTLEDEVMVSRLRERGLVMSLECEDAYHWRTTALGRLALQIDTVARGLVSQ